MGISTTEKKKFLEEQGWIKMGSFGNWFKKEWENESERLNLEAHLCPHWYHPGETLEDAYLFEIKELTTKTAKAEYALDTAKLLERTILNAMRGSEWGDVRSAVKGFAKAKLFHWYLSECETCGMKPNPHITEEFNKKFPDLSNDSSPMNTFARDNYGE